MTHQRARHIAPVIAGTLKHSPSVALMGMRQVGKTTLLKAFANTYETFDDSAFSARFERERDSLLQDSRFPLALDEVQKYPPAFDALKLFIDRKKMPGRYLLSGSVRFAARSQIRESLTGRISLVQIFPFTASECHSMPLNPLVELLLQGRSGQSILAALKKNTWATASLLEKYMECGGLPGVCFKRDQAARHNAYEAHFDTLLSRDIHLIRGFKFSPQKMRGVLTELAKRQGEKINLSLLARVASLSVPTTKSLLQAFEGLYLIRPYGDEMYFEDPGLSHHLYEDVTGSLNARIRCLYYQLRAQVGIHGRNLVSMEPYRTRGGLYAPFFLRKKNQPVAALFFDKSESPSDKSLVGLATLKKRHKDLVGIILCERPDGFIRHDGTLVLPWEWLA